MIREPYNINPYNSTIDTSKVNNFGFTFSGDELGSWKVEIAKNNTSPDIVYTSKEFVPSDVGYEHIYDGDRVEGITLPSTIAHNQEDDGLLRRLYDIVGYPYNTSVVRLAVNDINDLGKIKGSTSDGYLVATTYSLGRENENVTILGYDENGVAVGSEVTNGTYNFLGYLLTVKANSNIAVGQKVQIEGNTFTIGDIEDTQDGYYELMITNGTGSFSGDVAIATFDTLASAEVTELKIALSPKQDLSNGDPSPTNICPIYPSNGVNLVPSIAPTVTRADVTYTPNADGSIYAHGTASATSYYCFTSADGDITNYSTPILKAGTVVYGTTKQLQTRYTDGTYGSIGKNTAVTLAKDVGCVYIQYSSGTVVDETVYPMVSLAPHEYVPYQGIKVKHFGKNLFDANSFIHGYWSSTKWNENSTWGGVLIPCKPNQKISVSGNPTEQGVYGAWLNQHETPTQGLIERFSYKNVSLFTAPSGAYGFWLPLYKGNDWSSLQIEYADAPTTYEAPTDNSHFLSLGQSVYGGTLDVVSGKLVVEWISATYSSVNGFSTYSAYCNTPDNVAIVKATSAIKSSYLKTYNGNANTSSMPDYSITNMGGATYIFGLRLDSTYTSKADYDAFLSANPLQVILKLATPTEVDLTPTQISTLIGTNNIWSSGNILNITFSYEES